MSEQKDTTTIFIHIPKTAGTTFRSILEGCFPEDQLFFLYLGNATNPGMEEFEALTIEEKKKIQVYCGHFDFGFHRHLPQPCKYLTIMREPVERTISLYHHLLREENAKQDQSVAEMQKRIKNENLSLEQFVSSGVTLDTDNAQTRILSGESPKFGHCSRETLEKAKKNLQQHFIATGLTERFDESILLIHKLMGWPTPFYVKKNVASNSPKKGNLSQDILDTIKSFNEFDSELYEFAEGLLNKEIKNMGLSFIQEVEAYKIANQYYAEIFAKTCSIKTLETKIIGMENSLSWKLTSPLRKAFEMFQKIKSIHK